MAENWKISQNGGFAIKHISQPLSFTGWSGNLSYFDAGALLALPLDLSQSQVSDSRIRFEYKVSEDTEVTFQAQLENLGEAPLQIEKLTLKISSLETGPKPGRITVFKQGYQSWTETHCFSSTDRELISFLPPMTVLQANPRNLPSGVRGEVTSEMFSVVADLDQNQFILIGQLPPFDHFFYVNVKTTPSLSVDLVLDLGGKTIPPHGTLSLDPFIIQVDTHANRIVERYLSQCKAPSATQRELPVGWCSWYYYYTKITQADMTRNLSEIARRKVQWQFFVLDDGYQTAVGDWLSLNSKFPDGLKAFAESCQGAGIQPGIWLAPFIARGNSRLFHEHPEWFLKGPGDKPAFAGWNPNWGIEGRFYGLDTTHPGVQEYLRNIVHTLVHDWGFKYLKLDFTYGASLYAKACDQSLSPAERLKLGYRLIREAASPDTFILGCGSPLTPAIDTVDAMRIGPDVAPYWFDSIRVKLTRDPNALCAKFAIRSILTRAQFHRRLWINDPDCLLIRDSETKLTPHERLSLVNAIIVTGGMLIFSDKLPALANDTWRSIDVILDLVRQCDRGLAWPLDYMETAMPELVYNSAGYLAVFNFADRPVHKQIDFRRYLSIGETPLPLKDIWTGQKFTLANGVLVIGEMPPHSSLLFSCPKDLPAL